MLSLNNKFDTILSTLKTMLKRLLLQTLQSTKILCLNYISACKMHDTCITGKFHYAVTFSRFMVETPRCKPYSGVTKYVDSSLFSLSLTAMETYYFQPIRNNVVS